MAAVDKIDSNVSGLSIAREASNGVLPGSPIWVALEPNEYGDFGAALSTTAREPISRLRQNRKGVTTDLDASGSFGQDLTMYSFADLWEGMMLATKNAQPSYGGRNASTTVSAVSGTAYDLGEPAAALGFVAGMLIHTEGFGVAANNSGATVREITSVTGNTLVVTGTAVEASPPQDAIIRVVGFEFATADVDVVRAGGDYPTLVSSVADMTDFGLEIGDWVRIGGAVTGNQFNNAGNTTFARVGATPTATVLQFDLTTGGTNGSTEMTAETGTGKDIQIFFADSHRNVASDNAAFNQITYHLERSLGEADDTNGEIQGEVVEGALVNTMTFNVPTADKVVIDAGFLATAVTNYTGAASDELPTDGATINQLQTSDAFNTTDNVPDIRLFLRSTDPAAIVPSAFFAYVAELTMNVSNNATANKAVGTLGAFAVTAGNFTVSSEMTGYFQNVTTLNAVVNNSDVGLYALFKQTLGARQAGMLIDLPYGSVTTSGLNVAGDEPITAPLTLNSAVDPTSSRTMTLAEFWFLPE